MICASAANDSGGSIPFVAARRVYFDTPPLKGLRLEPFGSICNRAEKKEVLRSETSLRFHLEPRIAR